MFANELFCQFCPFSSILAVFPFVFFLSFFKTYFYAACLFIFGCAGSSLLCGLCPCFGAQAPGVGLSGSGLWAWSPCCPCNPAGWTPAPCIGMGRWILNLGPPGKPLLCFFAGPRRKQVRLRAFPTTGIPEHCLSSGSAQGSSLVTLLPILVTRMSWSLPQPPPLHISFVNSFWPKSTVFTQVVGGIRVFSECSEF